MSKQNINAAVLVVEDDPTFQELTRHYLQNKGFRVDLCSNAESALEHLRVGDYDLLLLDHILETKMDGLDLLTQVRADGNEIAVVMMTGTKDQDLVIQAMRLGALDFVKKRSAPKFLAKLENAVLRGLHVSQLERKMRRTHAALQESEQRYRNLFMNSKAVTLIFRSGDGQVIDANKAACDFYGYSCEELLALTASDLNMECDEVENSKSDQQNHFYCKQKLADGSVRDVEVYTGPIEMNGETFIYSIIHDISARLRAENIIAGQHRTLERLAKQEPLEKVLDELTVMLEVECPGAHFAIFSVKGDQNFYLESAPQLPKGIVEEIRRKGLLKECHLIQGDCEHEDFEEFTDDCKSCQARKWFSENNIQGTQVEPILSSDQEMIGAFCAFYPDDMDVNKKQLSLEFMKKNASLAGIAIEHHKQVQSIGMQAEFLQTVIDAVPMPIYYKDEEARYTGCNRAMAEFCERPVNQIIGHTLYDLFPNEGDPFSVQDQKVFEEGGAHRVESSVTRSDGLHYVLSYKARFEGPKNRVGIVGSVVDITDSKLTENELKLSKTVFETTSEAIVVTDLENKIQAVNPSFTHVTGYTEKEVLGKDPAFLSSGRHDAMFYQRMWTQLVDTGRWQGEIWNRRKNGDLYAEWLSISAVYDSAGKTTQYVAVFSDITKRKKAEELIRHQANYDALTNLPNRSLFVDRLSRATMRAKRQEFKVALMLLDLDRFKSVNDTLGHNTGDLLLREAAVRISHCVRETDTVSRLGGDEFTVILPDLKLNSDIEKVVSKILKALADPFLISGHEIFISGSVGITVFPDDGRELELLLRNADTAMYRAKEAGRNGYRFFTAEMNAEAHQQMILERDMRQAIEREEFVVFYQPVVDIASGKIVSCEALVRWEHPDRGLLGPGYFIALAEENGLINEIGGLVLKQVVQQIKKWQSDPIMRTIRVAVNLSTRQLQSENLLEDLKNFLAHYDISAQSLTFEVTETLVMQDPEHAANLLEEIRGLGFKVSLDDFGTGYSSLNYLKRFSFDVLKIDRSFIMDLESDEGDSALVEAIIVMAHKLGIKVIAEGVENHNQRIFVSRQNCDFIQGFLYSEPIPCDAFQTYCIEANT
ncbi:MAG: EAL domain-containing protein [Methylocystaceae bacterium]|nr:EAL domain-containing protein [Methylocystaceae bacterium]